MNCPICDGRGFYRGARIIQEMGNDRLPMAIFCEPCDGKGKVKTPLIENIEPNLNPSVNY